MVFRLPTHLEPFIPPLAEQMPPTRPWRGTLFVSYRSPDIMKTTNQELRVTAVETDGENRVDLWPPGLVVQPVYDHPLLREVQAWAQRHAPPICTFLPERLRDANDHAVNQSNFRSLSRILYENQMVAVATWNAQDHRPGGSIILYPAQNSTALLVGAIFLSTPLPDFVAYHTSVQMMLTASGMSSRPPQQIQAPQAPYGLLLRSNSNGQASTSYRPPLYLPLMASPEIKQDPFRFLTQHPGFPSSSSDPNWPAVKEEAVDHSNGFQAAAHRYDRSQDQQQQQFGDGL